MVISENWFLLLTIDSLECLTIFRFRSTSNRYIDIFGPDIINIFALLL